jgi:hypothetical protein
MNCGSAGKRRPPQHRARFFASGGVRFNGRELLFGEAKEFTAGIILLFDWGGEEK